MLFNSMTFILFFITVFILHYTLPHRFRWMMLLVASYIFYMAWRFELIFLLLFSTFVNYFISLLIAKSDVQSYRKKLLIICLVINFALLFTFKYLVFINHTFMFVYHYFGIPYPISDFNIILPMGISFYTFQASSYTIDVYRGSLVPEKNFFKFSLFKAFFPQLVAGPIERADRLLPSLFTKKQFSIDNLSLGLKIMMLGFFKKIVIADRVAIAVNTVYNSPNSFDGFAYVIATVLFAFQIYCDFSGYSDIAIGCAKTLGVDLMENFHSPYYSHSIREFWKRWHISLSTWFRDYLYIPLGGNRVGKARNYFNLFITFLISGIWHGANWTFFIWGTLHGLYQIIGTVKQSLLPRRAKPKRFWPISVLNVFITFCLVCFAWIFFRANTVEDAFYIVSHLSTGFDRIFDLQYVYNTINNLGLSMLELGIAAFCIVLLLGIELFENKESIHKRLDRLPFVCRFIFYYGIAMIILSCGVFGNASEFIYFQF